MTTLDKVMACASNIQDDQDKFEFVFDNNSDSVICMVSAFDKKFPWINIISRTHHEDKNNIISLGSKEAMRELYNALGRLINES